ncbi:MAG: Na/Pi symporter [candidate division WOR-3 bacterium]
MLHKVYKSKYKVLFHLIFSIFFLYLFFLGVELLTSSLKAFGSDFARKLITATTNPFTGLFIGLLSTAIIQSSSVTTSITVGFVSAGTLTIRNAIPIIMGANIGTTITCAIASFGHFSIEREFSKAFPAAIVHDIFNILSVIIFLPIELFFHPVERVSILLTHFFIGKETVCFTSPLKLVVAPIVERIMILFGTHCIFLAIISLGVIILAITSFVSILRKASAERFEILIDQYLFRNDFSAWVLGLCLTAFIQSSSITTSLVVSLVGTQIITIEKAYPYTLGANLGTTVTAILAALATGNSNGVAIAFSHSLFNFFGILVWYPLRRVPLTIAKKIGALSGRRRLLAFVYIIVIFIIIPMIGILLGR